MKNTLPLKGLYVITPDTLNSNELYTKAEQSLQGGVALFQYRDKISAPEEKLKRANTLHTICLNYNVPLIINDDPHLALACQAEGVHLGQSDGSIQKAREIVGKNSIIGITCHHDVALAITAQEQGADYVAFGRFFNSNTKPGIPLATPNTLNNAKNKIVLPIVAIGGITYENASPIIEAGASFIAVIEGVFAKPDTQQACQAFSKLFK